MPPKPSAASAALQPGKHRHIYAIDYVRMFVITSVVAIHVVSQLPTTVMTGAVLSLLHVNREIFVVISSFVLTVSYGMRPKVNWWQFYRKRYLLVGVPYVVWTALYVVADGHPLLPAGKELSTIGYYLWNGRARYQLYFLLILFQLYLVFPLLRRLLQATKRHHLALLVASGIIGVAFTAVVERSIGGNSIIGFWLSNPDPWLLSYQFYILVGAVAAWHYPALIRLVERWRWRVWGELAAAAAVLSVVVYLLQLRGGMSVDAASTTFQPVVILQSVLLGLFLLALGHRWEKAGARGKRWVMRGSVATFGVYLVHPLFIQLGVSAVGALGLAAALAHAPEIVIVALTLAVGLPLVMIASVVWTELVHATWLSLPLAGRPRQRPGQP